MLQKSKKLSKKYFKAFDECHSVVETAINEIPELKVHSHFSSFLPGDTSTLVRGDVPIVKVSATKPCLVCVVTFEPSF